MDEFRPLSNGDLHDRISMLEHYVQQMVARLNAVELPVLPESLPYLPLTGGRLTGGLSFGETLGASPDDCSKHISFWDNPAYGFSITSNRFNYSVVPGSATHAFRVGGVEKITIGSTGLLLGNDPTDPTGATTKAYVDAAIAAIPAPEPPATAAAAIGDVKYGLQMADHDGWIHLDGRALTTLTASQQGNAATLGLADTIPNATDAVLLQSSALLGDVDGSMARSIVLTQANLPNVSLTAASDGDHTHPVEITGLTTSPAGAHNHLAQSNVNDQGIQNFNEMLAGHGGDDPGSVYPAIKWRGTATIANTANNGSVINGYMMDGAQDHVHPVSNSGGTIAEAGAHTHSVALGGSATPIAIDVTPRSLAVNCFLFLGEA